jgi:hypothetical protein
MGTCSCTCSGGRSAARRRGLKSLNFTSAVAFVYFEYGHVGISVAIDMPPQVVVSERSKTLAFASSLSGEMSPVFRSAGCSLIRRVLVSTPRSSGFVEWSLRCTSALQLAGRAKWCRGRRWWWSGSANR